MTHSTDAQRSDSGGKGVLIRCLLIAVPVVVLLVAVTIFLLVRGQDLKTRSARIVVGMSREQVEGLLGPPVLVLNRTAGRGMAFSWTDQLWQVDVLTGPDGRVENIGCVPSHSFLRGTIGRIVSLPK